MSRDHAWVWFGMCMVSSEFSKGIYFMSYVLARSPKFPTVVLQKKALFTVFFTKKLEHIRLNRSSLLKWPRST